MTYPNVKECPFDGAPCALFNCIDNGRCELVGVLCEDCPPDGYPTDATRCLPCPRRPPPPLAQGETR